MGTLRAYIEEGESKQACSVTNLFMPEHKLKVGILLDSLLVPQWVKKIIDDIEKSDCMELDLVVLNRESVNKSPWFRLGWLLPRVLFLSYEWIDELLCARNANNASAIADLEKPRTGTNVIEVVRERTGSEHRFEPKDLSKIQSRELDVLLRFGFSTLSGGILDAARYGVWSVHHGDNCKYRGGPPLFWEIYEGNVYSVSTLQRLSEQPDGGTILYRSRSATYMTSLFRNRNPVYWKTASFLIRRLSDLHRWGWQHVASAAVDHDVAYHDKSTNEYPSNIRMVAFLAKLAYRNATDRFKRRFFRQKWFLGFRETSDSASEFIEIAPARDSFLADPFVVVSSGQRTVFFEDFDIPTAKGVIAHTVIGMDGKPSESKVSLERDYHLSYPMIFQWQGAYYMIPETRQNGTIELYRASRFPDCWELEKILFKDIEAVDSTVYFNDDGVWLFTNIAPPGGSAHDELYLFHAKSPFGEWAPHPFNPVVSDVGRARPAGHLFHRNGVLIRPSQDCSVRYGYAINFNRVDVITPTEYRETLVDRMTPEIFAGSLGTHTYNSGGGLEVVDVLRSVGRW